MKSMLTTEYGSLFLLVFVLNSVVISNGLEVHQTKYAHIHARMSTSGITTMLSNRHMSKGSLF
jgi:hypothetical protein